MAKENILIQPFTGARYVLRGLGLIRQPGIRLYVLIPLLLNTLLFAVAIWFAVNQMGALLAWLLPPGYDWLEWLLWPLFGISLLLVLFYCFTLVANFIGAPFNGMLSQRIEDHLTGKQETSGATWMSVVKDIGPSLISELKKLMYLMLWSIPLLLLFLVPVLNLFAPLLWIVFTAWMLTLEYMDYPMGNHGLTFSEQRKHLARHRFMGLGFGGVSLVLTMIPIVNFIAMPTAVAGATAMWVEKWRQEQ